MMSLFQIFYWIQLRIIIAQICQLSIDTKSFNNCWHLVNITSRHWSNITWYLWFCFLAIKFPFFTFLPIVKFLKFSITNSSFSPEVIFHSPLLIGQFYWSHLETGKWNLFFYYFEVQFLWFFLLFWLLWLLLWKLFFCVSFHFLILFLPILVKNSLSKPHLIFYLVFL